MVRKIGLIFLTMLFCGTLAWSHVYAAHNHSAAATEKQTAQETTATKEKPVCPYAGGDTACKSGKDCPCPHCKTGQGSCACKAGVKECPCPMRSGKMMAAADTPAKTPQKPTDESSYAQTMMSKQGNFKVTYTSEPAVMPIGQIISWKLKVQAPDGKPITDAAITVDGDMPEHGHGLPTVPKVTQNIGDGTYLVGGIKFSMPGWWTMTFTIKSGDRTDSVTFNLQLK